MRTIAGAALIAAAMAAGTPAHAAWRVVGPGMAVDEARSGGASLAVECHDNGVVIAVYNLAWDLLPGDPLDIVIDGAAFTVHQFIVGDRIVLTEAIGPDADQNLSPGLRSAFETGREAKLEGRMVEAIDPAERTFGLLGSRKAIETVERFCE